MHCFTWSAAPNVPECGPSLASFTVQFGSMTVRNNGTVVGSKGAIRVHAEVLGTGSKYDRDFTGVTDGSTLTLDWPLTLEAPERASASFTVAVDVTSLDYPAEEKLHFEHKHLFTLDKSAPSSPKGTWNDVTTPVNMTGVIKQLDVDVGCTVKP